MLRHEDNMALTQVGPGTPMGRFMRRYWLPAAKLEQLGEAGGAPARVKLLGESLVAFRDPAGKPGLIGEFCPHRGASLAYGRNEEGGLRCLYHGWKMGCSGYVLESPPEPPARTFAKKLAHVSYPVREAGGLLWTYMGPSELEPPFPRFPWLDLPADHLLVVKMHQATNYLQGVEGDLDPAHPNYLHRDFTADDDESWAGAGWRSIAALMADGSPDIECEETPYLMRIGAIRKTNDASVQFVRSYEWIAPFYCYIPAGPHKSLLFKAWHPIDDFNCYTFYIHFDPRRPLDVEAIYANWGHRTAPPDYMTEHSLANMHLQDRARMKRTKTFRAYRERQSRTAPCRKAWARSSTAAKSISVPAIRPSSSIAACCCGSFRRWMKASHCRRTTPRSITNCARVLSTSPRTALGRRS